MKRLPFSGLATHHICAVLADVDRLKPAVVIDEKVERWLHASFQHG